MIDTIFNEDCFVTMERMESKSINLIVTDPPYEVQTDSKSGGHLGKTSTTWKLSEINKGFDYDFFWTNIKRICSPLQAYIFCSNAQISRLMQLGEKEGYITTLLVWNKYNSIPFSNGTWKQDAEFIVHIREAGATFQGAADIKSKVITHPINPSRWGHPTEKPITIVKRFILISSNEGDIVYDPFMGSGTTARACLDLGRRYIGSEIHPDYHAAAEQRLRQTVLL
jgi:site-specific DNA-methyltransferase (adenine-specific)